MLSGLPTLLPIEVVELSLSKSLLYFLQWLTKIQEVLIWHQLVGILKLYLKLYESVIDGNFWVSFLGCLFQ